MPVARPPSDPPLRTRIAEGVGNGLKLALGLSIVAAGGMAVTGGVNASGSAPAPLAEFVILYFVCGIAGGAVHGALQPFRSSWAGSILSASALGLVCAVPLLFIVGGWSRGGMSIRESIWILVLITGSIGVFFGLFDWGRRHEQKWVGPLLASLLLLTWILGTFSDHLPVFQKLSVGGILQAIWPVILAGGIVYAIRIWRRRGSDL